MGGTALSLHLGHRMSIDIIALLTHLMARLILIESNSEENI